MRYSWKIIGNCDGGGGGGAWRDLQRGCVGSKDGIWLDLVGEMFVEVNFDIHVLNNGLRRQPYSIYIHTGLCVSVWSGEDDNMSIACYWDKLCTLAPVSLSMPVKRQADRHTYRK